MNWRWKPYVPVAQRRAKAQAAAKKASGAGHVHEPVTITSRTIATTVWGKAWCDNLEAYSDYANRLPRGRSYVRNGSVIDLKIEPGKVAAQVMGSSLYQVRIDIAAVPEAHWKKLVQGCTGSVATLIELLQGQLSKSVMERLCAPRTGLFPTPKEIGLHCSCPDWASMCKHVAATLYGVGARLDSQPQLLFQLRQVDPADLLAPQAADLPAQTPKVARHKRLDDAALADVFGLELTTDTVEPEVRATPARRNTGAAPAAKAGARLPGKKAAQPEQPTAPRPKPAAKKAPAARKQAAPSAHAQRANGKTSKTPKATAPAAAKKSAPI